MPLPFPQGFVNVPIPGTSVPLAPANTLVLGLRVQARSSPTSQNVGNVYIVSRGGSKGTAATIYAILGPENVDGEEIPSKDGRPFDASQWAVDADTTGDGVLVGGTN